MQPATVVPSPTVVLRAGAATSSGKRRRDNEDAHAVGDRLCLVADGMGGHAAGDVASALAVTSITGALARPGGPLPVTGDLVAAVRAANRRIRDTAAQRPEVAGMGTTVVGAAVVASACGPAVAVFHVGDSRCYRWLDGELRLLTRDHSLVQQLVDEGRLSPADAERHPMANVVTRALGPDPDVQPDVTVIEPVACRLLLCSDGLHDELPARAIGRVLAGIDDPQVAAERLVDLVLLGPARDNVTALVVDVIMLDTSGAVDHDGARPGPTAPR